MASTSVAPSTAARRPAAGTARSCSGRAAAALAALGPNSVEDAPRLGALRLLLTQFESPLVLILAFAAIVSLVLRQWVDAGIILIIVLGSSLLGFYQEHRASQAVADLKKRLALTARVLRDGTEQALPVTQLVPGDVILLAAGNLIPADGLVLEAQDFLVSEASMTGESFPVEKRPGLVAPDAPLARRTNSVFLGASVRSGTAHVLVTATGRRTEFGAIAARLRARPPETDFARGVRQFGDLLIRVMMVIVLFVLAVVGYGTKAGLPPTHFYGPSTVSADRTTLYLFVLDRPWREVAVKGLRNKVKSITLLGHQGELPYRISGGAEFANIPGVLWIQVPAAACYPLGSVLKIELAGPLDFLAGEGQIVTQN